MTKRKLQPGDIVRVKPDTFPQGHSMRHCNGLLLQVVRMTDGGGNRAVLATLDNTPLRTVYDTQFNVDGALYLDPADLDFIARPAPDSTSDTTTEGEPPCATSSQN